MFSPNAKQNTRLLDSAFIAGVSQENIHKYLISSDSDTLVPECLLTFTNTEDSNFSAVLDVKFLISEYLVCLSDWYPYSLFRGNS